MANTPEVLLLKAFSVIGMSFAARGAEFYDIDFDQIVRLSSADGRHSYEVFFERSKTSGPSVGLSSMPINGDSEIRILDEYIDCFNSPQRKGRFFKKLKFGEGKIVTTNQVIGHNTAANYGKVIAGLLKLPEPERYTGHCWRRTATTFAADKGLTLPQIKVLTGHKSDTVVQGYIDNSKVMKNLCSSAVSVSTRQYQSVSSEVGSVEQPTKKAKLSDNPMKFNNITINVQSVSGNFTAFNSFLKDTEDFGE
jgi:hypothetical protein